MSRREPYILSVLLNTAAEASKASLDCISSTASLTGSETGETAFTAAVSNLCMAVVIPTALIERASMARFYAKAVKPFFKDVVSAAGQRVSHFEHVALFASTDIKVKYLRPTKAKLGGHVWPLSGEVIMQDRGFAQLSEEEARTLDYVATRGAVSVSLYREGDFCEPDFIRYGVLERLVIRGLVTYLGGKGDQVNYAYHYALPEPQGLRLNAA